MKYMRRFNENIHITEDYVLQEIDKSVNYKVIDYLNDKNLKYIDKGLESETKLEVFIVKKINLEKLTQMTSTCFKFYSDCFNSGEVIKETELKKYKEAYNIFKEEGISYRYSIYHPRPMELGLECFEYMKSVISNIKGVEILLTRNTSDFFIEIYFKIN